MIRSLILLPLLARPRPWPAASPRTSSSRRRRRRSASPPPLAAERHALRGADRQHRGLQHRRPGGPRRGLPDLASTTVDGALVKKGDLLFVIEQTMYKAKVKEAEAELDSAKAQLLNAEAEFTRQETLLRQNVTAQNTYDQAKAKRDSAGPTSRTRKATSPSPRPTSATPRCTAPFDGIVTKHLVSVGELVGNGDGDQARHHRPARPDLRRIQRERAGRARRSAPTSSRPAPDRRGAQQDPARYRPDERGRLPAQGRPQLRLARDRSHDRHDPGARPVRESQSRPAAGLLRPHQGADWASGADGRAARCPTAVIAEDQAGKYLLVVNKDERRRAAPRHDRPAAGRRPAGDRRAASTPTTASC